MTSDESDPTAEHWLSGARAETLAIRAGIDRTAHGEHSEAIFTTSSYVFDSCAEAAARFSGEQGGNVYSRYTNPTVTAFEQRLASLEGAEVAVGTASGMSAILATCMAFLQTGDHVVCSRDVFGSTVGLFEKYLPRMGIGVSFVSLGDLEAWRAAVTPATRLFYCETPSNPICEVADVEALSALARASGARLVVDNCFCTPALQQPLALGADVVIHSATKYLDGQGRMLGGAVLG
ncbi:MAG: aminotransferase class I/II-fold pyridoxal phosphate-dependent enzyme, partial [Luminiphilus sp.]